MSEPSATTESASGPSTSNPKVHEIYDFTSSGDQLCKIQVENTLFKIHRYLLVRDSVVFQDMFSFDGPSGEGGKDSETITLQGDTEEDFSALCWALYAQPTELTAQMSETTADIQKIATLLRIANKYQFLALETWSITVLRHHCGTYHLMKKCNFDDLCSLLEVASLPASPELLDAIEAGISEGSSRLREDDVPWDKVLPVIEEHCSRRFRGKAYYYLLLAVEKSEYDMDWDSMNIKARFPFSLTAEQATRLQAGGWALTKLWNYIPIQPLRQAEECQAHASCQQRWYTLLSPDNSMFDWDGYGARVQTTDVVRRLMLIIRYLGGVKLTQVLETNIHPACIEVAIEDLRSRKETLVQNLPNYFRL